jgi:hypothetical protein
MQSCTTAVVTVQPLDSYNFKSFLPSPHRTYSADRSAALDFMTSTAVAYASAVPLQAQGAS